MVDAISIISTRLLLAEGQEEERFWQALLHGRGRYDIQVIPGAGKTTLGASLRAVTQTPGFDQVSWLGIVRDADSDAHAAFQSVRSALTQSSLPVPSGPWQRAGTQPEVVAIILPDGQATGDLEELVWQAVASEPAGPCVTAFMDCLEAAGIVPSPRTKARVHAFLSSRTPPDMRLGDAALRGLIPLESAVFDSLFGVLP